MRRLSGWIGVSWRRFPIRVAPRACRKADAHASHAGLQRGADLDASGIGADDAFPLFLPLSHIYGVMLMNAALASGAHQVLMERFDLEMLVTRSGAITSRARPRAAVLLALANAPGLDDRNSPT